MQRRTESHHARFFPKLEPELAPVSYSDSGSQEVAAKTLDFLFEPVSHASSEFSIAERLNLSRQVWTVHKTDPAIWIQTDVDGKHIISALEIQPVD